MLTLATLPPSRSHMVEWPAVCCLLQEASQLAEFHSIWRVLASGGQPGGASASASGNANGSASAPVHPESEAGSALERLLATRTPARVLLSRMPPDAENQLYFMLTQVTYPTILSCISSILSHLYPHPANKGVSVRVP